jgi:hypothetical protein
MGSELAFPFMHLFYLIEGLLYLLFGKGLATLGALVNHISQFIINKLVGKIDVMKPDREIVDALEVLILATVAQKVILDNIHPQLLP